MSTHGKESRPRAQKHPARPRPERRRKIPVRPQPGRHAGRAVAAPRELSPLNRLIEALDAEKIRFILIGMTAGVLQGTPVTTFDVDLWMDLPSRQYIKVMNLALKVGGQMVANTVAVLPGDLPINFIYAVAGLNSFESEYRKARKLKWMGRHDCGSAFGAHLREQEVCGPPKGPRALAAPGTDNEIAAPPQTTAEQVTGTDPGCR